MKNKEAIQSVEKWAIFYNKNPKDKKVKKEYLEYVSRLSGIEQPKPTFKEISEGISELLEYKNKQYGNAALEPLNIFRGKTKLGERIDEKLSRVKNSEKLRKNDVVDLIGCLYLVCQEYLWYCFKEFMD